MTETNLCIGPRDGVQRPGWMGRTMPGFAARVIDPSGAGAPDGTPGSSSSAPSSRARSPTAT